MGLRTLEVCLRALPRELYEANARVHDTFANWAVTRDLKPFSAGEFAPVSQCQFAILEQSLCQEKCWDVVVVDMRCWTLQL